jgi:hypothetical protein
MQVKPSVLPLLLQALPANALCQGYNDQYYAREESVPFVNLLLSTKPTLFDNLKLSDSDMEVAIQLAATHRYGDGYAQLLKRYDQPLPVVPADEIGIEWAIVDARFPSILVTLVRHEMTDTTNSLFRRTAGGASLYVPTDIETLSKMTVVLREVRRDLMRAHQPSVANEVQDIAKWLGEIRQAETLNQPFWKKPWQALWPTILVSAASLLVGSAIGGYITGRMFALSGHHEHARQLRLMTEAAAKEAAKKAEQAAKQKGDGRGPKDPPPPAAGSPGASASTAVEERVDDGGEAGHFQALDDHRHQRPVEINGTAVAAVLVVGGVLLLLPEVAPALPKVVPVLLAL